LATIIKPARYISSQDLILSRSLTKDSFKSKILAILRLSDNNISSNDLSTTFLAICGKAREQQLKRFWPSASAEGDFISLLIGQTSDQQDELVL
jgi:hypothetical protein